MLSSLSLLSSLTLILLLLLCWCHISVLETWCQQDSSQLFRRIPEEIMMAVFSMSTVFATISFFLKSFFQVFICCSKRNHYYRNWFYVHFPWAFFSFPGIIFYLFISFGVHSCIIWVYVFE